MERDGYIRVSRDETGDIWLGGHTITGVSGTLQT